MTEQGRDWEPRRRWRRGSILLCGCTLGFGVLLVGNLGWGATPPEEVFFELSPAQIGTSGLPRADWLRTLTPRRDAAGDLPTVLPLRIPAKAAADLTLRRVFRLLPPDSTSSTEWLKLLQIAPGVVWAEAPPIRHTDVLPGAGRSDARPGASRDGINAPPDDPFYPLQWSLHAIHADAGWDVTRGNDSVTIAIVDAGSDIGHSDLFSKKWVNRAEELGSPGVDDDGNGFIDDINGWDFVDDDSDPRPPVDPNHPEDPPPDTHGTHVAGLAAAATDNGFGIAGVAWRCRVMAIRVGVGTSITHGYEGLIYAAAAGADVINLSWGSEQPSNIERIAAEYALGQGSLVVAAAGNIVGGVEYFHYPAAYAPVLAVTAVDDNNLRAYFSNVGAWVDIAAPGLELLSLLPGGRYGVQSGTSMATPLVSGAAALVKALHPDWTPPRIRLQLETSADPIDDLNADTLRGRLGRGRLNVYRALADRRAGFELTNLAVDDSSAGDGDGIADPGERLRLRITIANLLTSPATVSAEVSSTDPLLRVEPVVVDMGEVAPGATADNRDTPYRVRISPNASSRRRMSCALTLTATGGTEWVLPFEIVVRPEHVPLRGGRVTLTVTDFGALGYYDYIHRVGIGEGYRFPAGGPSALFQGSLMVAASGGRVSDCAYDPDDTLRYDFISRGFGIGARSVGDGRLAEAEFSDAGAETPLGISVRQAAWGYPDAPDDGYVMLDYAFSLSAGRPALDSVYVGLFLDWDVVEADVNIMQWDVDSEVGWMELDRHQAARFGVGVVGQRTGFQAAIHTGALSSGWSDAEKTDEMRSGFSHAVGDESDDYAQLIGVGPFTLVAADTFRVTFALAAGVDVAELRANVAAARRRWGAGLTGEPTHRPTTPLILAVYPMPFNSRATLLCSLPAGGAYEWRLADVLGRTAATGASYAAVPGSFTIALDAHGLAAGSYIFDLAAAGRSAATPVVIVK